MEDWLFGGSLLLIKHLGYDLLDAVIAEKGHYSAGKSSLFFTGAYLGANITTH